ncbi:murein DD-endopeptidase MepM/ murein hydrolase activator NlpD [Bradyrhizobium sp. CIR18]|uniref:M23 family metallopeptidase n=1 Tax=Bradyrhizobium sp. CIR18 TaxID=2663839 RepID=UPI0016064872|nr:M23 family metallopeptidase [Bradyrhizobium sp. CIR18]MBB4364344.1 murein DD-endopeptidase MepM/ murein hydrolase activator NlpD [Bradyrhizobium sp. CIR18]
MRNEGNCHMSRFLAIFTPVVVLVVAVLFGGGIVNAAPCNTPAELAPLRNKYICPVVGGGAVRGPDGCAEGGQVNSPRKGGRPHNALDINANEGTGVVVSKPGRVDVAGDWGAMGKTVLIDHGDGDYSVYGHLQSVAVIVGKCVKAGDSLGKVGYTGNAKCLKEKNLIAHLHFAIIRAAKLDLAKQNGPIAAAIKNAEDWVEISQEYFQGDMLDLGIKNPEVTLQNTPGCLL